MKLTLWDYAPSYSTVAKWTNEFECGQESLEDDPHSCITTPEIIAVLHKIILKDCRKKVQEISKALGMSYEWAYNILSEELGVKILSARWVSLMQDQK